VSDLEQLIRQLVRDELAKQKPANDAVEWLSVALYAKRWSISQSTVREAIREGRLEHERVGRAVRISSAAKIGERASSMNDAAVLKLMRGGK
jgi:excisionase family DNA binding protein